MDDFQHTPSSTVTTMEPAVPGSAVDTPAPNMTWDTAVAGGQGAPPSNDAGMGACVVFRPGC